MEYISVGKIMEAFALKGEVKIASDFKFGDLVFKEGNTLYVGDNKKPFLITKTRFYKDRYYVLFKGFNHINLITPYLKSIVYFNKDDLILKDNYLNEDIIGFDIIEHEITVGKLNNVIDMGKNNEIFEIIDKNATFMIPNKPEFVKKIDFDNKQIIVELIKGMR